MIESIATYATEGVAIIGMAGRFPRARTLDEFWDRLQAGEELVSFFTDDELLANGIEPRLLRNPSYVKARAVLEDADLFDAPFFGINPREAELIDPQQRVFLECAWAALEHAGYDAERYAGAIGVFAGLSMNSYLFNNLARNPAVLDSAGAYQVMLASDKDFLATRLSYKLNLRGPSIDVQTACSTSLVAVQLACQSLLSFQSDIALAGGVSVASPRAAGYLYEPGMIMSPDGHCRAFDASGRGIVAGEGAGLVVLKRLSEALADGDTIHAVIRGSAVNNDGSQKVGFTAPSVDGQADVIATALAMAGVGPHSISYVEAHGTGTELGDPIEVAALTQAFRLGTQARGYCALGSVKTNIGHLDAAAGIAGLLKAVLALEHRQIPPSLHFRSPNPNIDFADSPFYVNSALQDWSSPDGEPRRAGVSSFGIGGTNAHVVLEEAPPLVASPAVRPDQLIVLSARSATALEQATDQLTEHLRNRAGCNLADVAYTLQTGRKAFAVRRAVAVSGDAQAAAALLESRDPRLVMHGSSSSRDRPVAFLFSGQGSQYVNMSRELYELEPVFRDEVDHCSQLLEPHLALDLRQVVYPAAEIADAAASQLLQTALAQPVLFVVEYALARLWMSWGVQPRAMLGHSIGEYVAACLAGVLSLEDALALVAARGRLMQALPGGSMLSVSLPEADLLTEIRSDPQLAVAAVNGPRLCAVSGPTGNVLALQTRLEADGTACRMLHTSHAFHSPMVDSVLDPFRKLVERVALHPPSMEYVSNLTGDWITAEQATDPGYWARHLRSSVRFADGLAALVAHEPEIVLLELGAGALTALVKQFPGRPQDQVAVASLRHALDPVSDHALLTGTLGRVWSAGVSIDWTAVHAAEQRHRVPLPTYPFERQRFWVEPIPVPASDAPPVHGLPIRRDDISTWFYQPSWRRVDLPRSRLGAVVQQWLILCDPAGLGDQLASFLSEQGQPVVRVKQNQAYGHPEADLYLLPVADPDGYEHLMRELRADGRLPQRIVHLWNFGPPDANAANAQDAPFYSLLHLAQALGEPGMPHTTHVDVIASGLCDVVGDETLIPERATLLGPCRVIPQEYPRLTCRVIDLPSPSLTGECVVETLWAELRAEAVESVVAYRGDHRWLPAVESVPLGPDANPVLRERGVYLIIGGLGGIGLELAAYLASSVQARLVLTGRDGLPARRYWSAWISEHGDAGTVSRRIRKVEALEALGAEVEVVKADVCDAVAMRQAVTLANARFGAIHGVVHAAGTADSGIIALKTRAMAEHVLAAKVRGAVIVDSALAEESLDFFALCSSLTSTLGGPGQVDYCAANAFLDAFAHARNRRVGGTLAINWGTWSEVGMAVETEVPAHFQRAKDYNISQGMRSVEGIEAFGRVLASGLTEVMVSPQDMPSLLRFAASVSSDGDRLATSMYAAEHANGIPASAHARPPIASHFAPPTTPLQEEIAQVWRTLLGIAEIGIDDSFFDLGGHSLLATQLIGRLQRLFGVELPLRSIFELQTVAQLAERIETIRWAADNALAGVGAPDGEREEIEF